MNEIQVVFQGMVLWWMATTPAQVLVPDLSKMGIKHISVIRAAKADFASGSCPPGFVESSGTCTFQLTGAGKAGGVQIELATSAAAAKSLTTAADLCPVPKLQKPPADELVLLPAYKPPHGSGNAAWMVATGGTGSAIEEPCTFTPDCPRYVRWTVPVASGNKVALVLKNLQSGTDLAAQLVPGAHIEVLNVPSAEILARRYEQRKKESRETASDLTAEDWCAYFQMVALKTRPDQPAPCVVKKPPIPACPTQPAAARRTASVAHNHRHTIETIACSSSQYP